MASDGNSFDSKMKLESFEGSLFPWSVENVDKEFLFYCCPQCEFRCKEKQWFLHHAYAIHPESQGNTRSAKSSVMYGGSPDMPLNALVKEEPHLDQVCSQDGLLSRSQREKAAKRAKDAEMRALDRIQCYRCGDFFPDQASVIQHQKSVHNVSSSRSYGAKRSIQCQFCKRMFADVEAMGRHVCDLVGNLKYGQTVLCKICGVSLTSEGYKYHMATFHVVEGQFPCDQCEYKGKTMRDLTKHQQLRHIRDFKHVCPDCGQNFILAYQLTQHMKKHTNENDKQSRVCEQCGKSFDSIDQLGKHRYEQHVVLSMCTLCNKMLNSKRAVMKHLITDHEMQCSFDELFICPECSVRLSSDARLDEHFALVHNMAKVHPCCDCDEIFHSKITLNIHLLDNHVKAHPVSGPRGNSKAWDIILGRQSEAVEKKGFKCDVCGRMCSTPGSLMEHKRQIHDKSNHMKCDFCDFTTFQQAKMRLHFKTKHDTSQTFSCDKCLYKCHYEPYMRKHIQTVHEKANRFSCEVCNDGFATKRNLKRHLWRAHNTVMGN